MPNGKDKFKALEERENKGFPTKSFFARDFKKIPLPTADSTSDELVSYWKRANETGARITAEDLKRYDRLLHETSQNVQECPRYFALR
jgi:hypothetical protein